MATTAFSPVVATLMAKDMMRDVLPMKVIKKITNVSEEYMIDRVMVGIKVQFENGLWSPALLMDDSESARTWTGDFGKRARNADEFTTWCLMMYEAGETYG